MYMCPFLIYCKKVHIFPRGATQLKGFIIHAESLVGVIGQFLGRGYQVLLINWWLTNHETHTHTPVPNSFT